MSDLLFEIGAEELPARAAPRALAELERLAREALAAQRLTHGELRVMGTPRRLALIVRELAAAQPSMRETVQGPPLNAGARAAEGFAKKHGTDVAALAQRDGRHVLEREVQGKDTRELLPALLLRLLREMPWPKPMRWASYDETFSRPVLWLVALFGGEVVPLEFAGVTAANRTRGHRFVAPGPFVVDGPDAWLRTLAQSHVVVDAAERRARIESALSASAAAHGLRVRQDDDLVEEVVWLVEEPSIVIGSFDRSYLGIPEPVVVSAMRKHQRYFSLEDGGGQLANRFAAVAGTQARDPAVVAHGNERVLAARLADARFFFEEDRKVSLSNLVERLRTVVFQSKLGTVYEKVERVAGLGIVLAQRYGGSPDLVAQAARLMKADLLSHVVGEFPDLQGVMGAAYARAEGSPEEVAAAIAEHYQPRFAGDRLPHSTTGAVLAVADRLDTLVGCFGEGLQPTGTADPYGLRRAAIGVCRILSERIWRGKLSDLVTLAAARYHGRYDQAREAVVEFVVGRLRGLLQESYPNDVVEAVLAAGGDDVVDLTERVSALAALRTRPDFEPLATTFKRVANILKNESLDGVTDSTLLRESAEQSLFREVERVAAIESATYGSLLSSLCELKPAVDVFFDAVLVMDPDPNLRRNRLALLGRINGLFRRVADFRQLAV